MGYRIGIDVGGTFTDLVHLRPDGGIMNGEWAGTYPVHTLLSGPAGGVVACAELIGDQCGRPDLITVDMGGTSDDVALIRAGRPALSADRWFSRYRVAAPMLDIHTTVAASDTVRRLNPAKLTSEAAVTGGLLRIEGDRVVMLQHAAARATPLAAPHGGVQQPFPRESRYVRWSSATPSRSTNRAQRTAPSSPSPAPVHVRTWRRADRLRERSDGQ